MSQTYKLQLKITGEGKDAKIELENLADASEEVDKKTRKASKGVKVLDDAVDKSKSTLKGWASAAVAAAAAAPTIVALSLAKNAMKGAAEVRKLTQELDVNAEAITQWQFATNGIDVDIAQVFQDINERSGEAAREGTGELVGALKTVGLSLEDIIDLPADQKLLKIGEALDKMGADHETRTSVLEDISSDASRLIPLLENGAEKFKEMAQKSDDLGVTLTQLDVEKLHIANQQFSLMGHHVDGVGNQLAIGLAPAFYAVMSQINDVALANGGWGDVANDVVEAIVDGAAWTLDKFHQIGQGYKVLKVLATEFAADAVQIALKAMRVLPKVPKSMIDDMENTLFSLEETAARTKVQIIGGELDYLKPGQRLKQGYKAARVEMEKAAQAAIDARKASNGDNNGSRVLGKDKTAGAKKQEQAAKAAAEASKQKAAEAVRAAQRIQQAIAQENQSLDEQIIRLRQGEVAARRFALSNKQITGAEQDQIIAKEALIKQLELQAEAQEKAKQKGKQTADAIQRHNDELQREYNQLTMLPEAYARWELAEEGITGKIADRILAQQAANDALEEAKTKQQEFAQSFEDDLLSSIKNGKLDFSNFVDHMIDEMLRMYVMKPLMDSLFNSMGSGAGGGFSIGSLFGFHSGGIAGVGEQSFVREIPRYHTGGIVGKNEVPAILERDEGVFTPGQMRAMTPVQPIVQAIQNQTAAPVVNVTIHKGADQDRVEQSQGQNGQLNLDVFVAQVEAGLARRMRTGGPLKDSMMSEFNLQKMGRG